MKSSKSIANLVLVFVAVLWGSGTVVTKMVLDSGVTPGFVNLSRGILFASMAFLCFRRRICAMTKNDFKIGMIAGLTNFGGYLLQTVGVAYTTPSNNAFICASYVVFVPFLAWLLYHKPLEGKSFVCIGACIAGMAILSGITGSEFTLNPGDVYSMISTLFYAWSITYLSYGCDESDPTVIAFLMAAVQAVGGLIYFMVVDGGSMPGLDWSAVLLPILYMGIMCSFLCQTCQVIAQRYTSATTASLILMLESVFGSIFSIMFGYEKFTKQLLLGGGIILVALVFMNIDFKSMKNSKEKTAEKI